MKVLFYLFLIAVATAAIWLGLQYLDDDPECVETPASGECAEGFQY